MNETSSDDFLAVARRVLKANTSLRADDLEDEAQSLAVAFAMVANDRIADAREIS